jgi:hypothetical protein
MSGDLLFSYAKVFRIGDGGAMSDFWSRERAAQITHENSGGPRPIVGL